MCPRYGLISQTCWNSSDLSDNRTFFEIRQKTPEFRTKCPTKYFRPRKKKESSSVNEITRNPPKWQSELLACLQTVLWINNHNFKNYQAVLYYFCWHKIFSNYYGYCTPYKHSSSICIRVGRIYIQYINITCNVDFRAFLAITRHVFVKHWCPRRQQVEIWKKSLSPIFWPLPTPGACDVSEVWGTHRWTYSLSLVTVSSPKL